MARPVDRQTLSRTSTGGGAPRTDRMMGIAGATCSRVAVEGTVTSAARRPNISGDAPTVTGERADPSVGCDAGPPAARDEGPQPG